MKLVHVWAALALCLVFTCGQAVFSAEIEGKVTATGETSAAPATVPSAGKVKYVRIPVFFLTDRNAIEKKGDPEGVKFGTERRYRGICQHHMYMGVAYCSIRNTEDKDFTDGMKSIGWTKSDKNGEGPCGTEMAADSQYDQAQAGFYDQVYKRATVTPDKELFMFVPGYMSTFESGLRSAARLSYYSERPVLLYSWPSKGKFTEYFSDEATIEWTQDHFNEVLAKFSELAQRDPGMHTRIYAHSMGGRLVLRATPLLKFARGLREVAVICPDVDDGVVKHYAATYFDGKSDILVRLYISKRDEMLKLSQLVHGGYGRLGEDRQPLDTLLPKNAPKLVAGTPDAENIKAANPALRRKMLTIDFTSVDVGTLGHRIPVELLAALSQTGQPGGNLTLCLAKPYSKKNGDSSCDTATAGDGIVRVLTPPHWQGTPILGRLYKYRPRLMLLITKDWSLK